MGIKMMIFTITMVIMTLVRFLKRIGQDLILKLICVSATAIKEVHQFKILLLSKARDINYMNSSLNKDKNLSRWANR